MDRDPGEVSGEHPSPVGVGLAEPSGAASGSVETEIHEARAGADRANDHTRTSVRSADIALRLTLGSGMTVALVVFLVRDALGFTTRLLHVG